MTMVRPMRQTRRGPVPEPGVAGGVVLICGPDGTGKSTLSRGLTSSLNAPVQVIHHRPGVLPQKVKGEVTDPRARPPYGRLASMLKIVYLWIDYVLGYRFRVRRFKKRGWVIIERGWPDLLVDPLRYRLSGGRRLLRFLRRFLPAPDLCIVLEAPVATLLARKQELGGEELERQTTAWRRMDLYADRTVYIDARADRAEIEHIVLDAIGRTSVRRAESRSGPGWTTLPSRRYARWILPRGPRRIAAESLRIYHPVTIRGLIGWMVAYAFARAGGFRLLPRSEGPPVEVMRVLAFYAGTDHSIALQRSRLRGGWIAMLIDRRGRARLVGPVATSPDARRDLLAKRTATSLVRQLPPPLSPPRILVHSSSVLLFEPVRWRPRLRAWRLPRDVAGSMGAYFRATTSNGTHSPSHNDFAPWNVLRSQNGWVVLDWEDPNWHVRVPFHDLFHYLVQAHALLGRPSRRALLAGLHGRGWVGDAVEAYRVQARRTAAEAPVAFASYLRNSLPLVDLTVPEGRKERRVRERLLRALSSNGTAS